MNGKLAGSENANDLSQSIPKEKLVAINLTANPPHAELFNKEAEDWAKRFHDAPKGKNATTQIRRFYDELVGWQARVNGSDDEFKKYEAFIKMLNAKVAYAKGRGLVDETYEKKIKKKWNYRIDA